jgi:hypothetical protein
MTEQTATISPQHARIAFGHVDLKDLGQIRLSLRVCRAGEGELGRHAASVFQMTWFGFVMELKAFLYFGLRVISLRKGELDAKTPPQRVR